MSFPKFAVESLYKKFFSQDNGQFNLEELNSQLKQKFPTLLEYFDIEKNSDASLEKTLLEHLNSEQNPGQSLEQYSKMLLLHHIFPMRDKDFDLRLQISYRLFYFFTLGFKWHREEFLPVGSKTFVNNFYNIYLAISNLQFWYFTLYPKVHFKMKNEFMNSQKINSATIDFYKISIRGTFKKPFSQNMSLLQFLVSARFAFEDILITDNSIMSSISKMGKTVENQKIKSVLQNSYNFIKENINNSCTSFSVDVGVQYDDWNLIFTKKYKNFDIIKINSAKLTLSKELFFLHIAAAMFWEKSNIKEKNNLQFGTKLNLGIYF